MLRVGLWRPKTMGRIPQAPLNRLMQLKPMSNERQLAATNTLG